MKAIYNITSKYVKKGSYIKFLVARDTYKILEKLDDENRRVSSIATSSLLYIPKFEDRPDLPIKNLHKYFCLISNIILLDNIEIQFFQYTMSFNGKNYEYNQYDALITFDAGNSVLTSVENNFDQLKLLTLKI